MYSNVYHDPIELKNIRFDGGKMARHYSAKDFFRQILMALLARTGHTP